MTDIAIEKRIRDYLANGCLAEAHELGKSLDFKVYKKICKEFGIDILLPAAASGDLPAVEQAMLDGSDIEVIDDKGRTAFILSAWRGRIDVVRFLKLRGANVFAKDKTDSTALHGAAIGGHYDAAEFLLDAGADIHAKTIGGDTTLSLAKHYGNDEIFDLCNEYASKKENDILNSLIVDDKKPGKPGFNF